MDTAHQWPREIVVKPMEEIIPTINTITSGGTNSNINNNKSKLERKLARPQKEQALNCPRCNSTNTKFCYYNNYSLSQPRYFCKTCRRYWTEGGSLRNIPVGGGSRKNRRSSSSATTTTTTSSPSSSAISTSSNNNINSTSLLVPSLSHANGLAIKKHLTDFVTPVPFIPNFHHQHQHQHQNQQNPNNNNKIHDQFQQDLNLGFSHHHDFKTISELIHVPNYEVNNKEEDDDNNNNNNPSSSSSTTSQLSALELLTGMTSSRGLMSSFIPSFPMHEFKPPSSLNFLDGISNNGGGYNGNNHHHRNQFPGETASGGGGGGRVLFPFEDLRSNREQNTSGVDNGESSNANGNGFWNGGGSW